MRVVDVPAFVSHRLSAIFDKGDNFFDFLFALRHINPFGIRSRSDFISLENSGSR